MTTQQFVQYFGVAMLIIVGLGLLFAWAGFFRAAPASGPAATSYFVEEDETSE